MKIETLKYEIDDLDAEAKYAVLVGPKEKWRETRDIQIGILERIGLTPEQTFLDLGCGSLRAGLPLIGYLENGNYHGADVAAECIAAAHELVDRFGLNPKAPKIVHSESFGLEEFGSSDGFDIIWCYQVFIHLSPEITRCALASMARLLKPSGAAFVTIRPAQDEDGLRQCGRWRGFPVIMGSLGTYETMTEAHGLAMEVLGTLADFGLPETRAGSQNLLLRLTRKTSPLAG